MQLSAYSDLAVRLANTAGSLADASGPAPAGATTSSVTGSATTPTHPHAGADATGGARGHARDALRTLDDLRALLAEQPTWRRIATEDDLVPMRRLRAEVLAIFRDAVDGEETVAVKRLNGLLSTARVMPQVTGHDGEDWHLHLAEGARTSAEGYAAAAALGLAFYVTEHGLTRLGICQSRPCHKVYIDVSTNRSRRYCSERCATRANVAAYRARKRARPLAAE